jgi:hypothetical protein
MMRYNEAVCGGRGRQATNGLALAALVTLLAGPSLRAADEAPVEEYARVEVRGALRKPDEAPSPVKEYRIVIGQGKDAQQYRLVLPDDETRRAAEELAGQAVVVTGDLRMREEVSFITRAGRRYIIGEIEVKSLKKASPAKK